METSDSGDLKRRAVELRMSIAKEILSSDLGHELPFVSKFRSSHEKLTAEREAARKKHEKAAKAAELLGQQESAVKVAQQEVTNKEAAVQKLARPIGESAFAAFRAGEIEMHPAFAARLHVQEQLDALSSEREQLAPHAGANVIEQAKAKSQQLVITGKIKLEETKLGELNANAGRELIAANVDGEIECPTTAAVLDQLKSARSSLLVSRDNLRTQQQSMDLARKKIQAALRLQEPVEDKAGLDVEVAHRRQSAGEAEGQLQQLNDALFQNLIASVGSIRDRQLRELVAQLEQCQTESAHVQAQLAANRKTLWKRPIVIVPLVMVVSSMLISCGSFVILAAIFILTPEEVKRRNEESSRAFVEEQRQQRAREAAHGKLKDMSYSEILKAMGSPDQVYTSQTKPNVQLLVWEDENDYTAVAVAHAIDGSGRTMIVSAAENISEYRLQKVLDTINSL